MRLVGPTDFDVLLAAAIGRFSQASAALEQATVRAIIRILPITENMGLALLADNSMSQNLRMLERLAKMPEVSLADEWRAQILERVPKVRQSTEDRNRLMHNPLIGGGTEVAGGPYMAMMHKGGQRVMMEVDVAAISSWAIEASEHAAWLGHVPHGKYDTSQWELRSSEYEVKDWPERRK
ncbi:MULTISPECIES: hypothetical protein [unclassified Ensifer]|uniref:hypothetical protein n=1 Tax=unclassified Ensifer TaxID=2633371 RepID=UPI000712677C|nr:MULTISPECIES: hypothetical protein [unclassified Ensifer]KQX40892.1 hypothetical protein ASD49_15625 [Ensifer sp. Root1298]KQX70213.1 hypothetical protein ASD41_16700 [Ensifer sp. Root1312]KRC14453.1 hypothetical protein ASE29_17180 [Ensifer sp. Root74]